MKVRIYEVMNEYSCRCVVVMVKSVKKGVEGEKGKSVSRFGDDRNKWWK